MVSFRDEVIAIIGAGHLGSAMIEHVYGSRGHSNIIATRRDRQALAELATRYAGIETSTDNGYAAAKAGVLVFGLKPSVLDDEGVIADVYEGSAGKLVVSLAAGRSINTLQGKFDRARVSRAMTGVFLKDEVAFYALGASCEAGDEQVVRYLAGDRARKVDERLLAHRTFIGCETGLLAADAEAYLLERSTNGGPSVADRKRMANIFLKMASYVERDELAQYSGECVSFAQQLEWKLEALADAQLLGTIGLGREYATECYAATMRAIAYRFEQGVSGTAILQLVAGPKSFTGELWSKLQVERTRELWRELVRDTVVRCSLK